VEYDNIGSIWHCHKESHLDLDSFSANERLTSCHGHLNSTRHKFRSKKRDCNNIIDSQVTLEFKIKTEDNNNSQGSLPKATFTYRYFPSDDSIQYIDVRYTNPKLQSMIECNPNIMKNIDSYIRDSLLVQKIGN
jgi:hypothetical protein